MSLNPPPGALHRIKLECAELAVSCANCRFIETVIYHQTESDIGIEAGWPSGRTWQRIARSLPMPEESWVCSAECAMALYQRDVDAMFARAKVPA